MINSLYGKLLQDNTKFNKTVFIDNHTSFLKATLKRRLINIKPINQDLLQLDLHDDEQTLKAPMHIGTAVLWYAKLLVNQFVYDFLFQIFDANDINICYTDTDSLYIHFKRDNYDNVMEKMKKHHDYERFMQIDVNDLTPGKMKIESKLKQGKYVLTIIITNDQ